MAAQQGGGQPISEFALAGFVLTLILILLMEMPNWVINFSISMNITLGVVLMMIALYVQKPLELAAFPSIILLGTMFRLILSIASTRLILAKGDAGEVVSAFGHFVTGGNMVVGVVIFLIITIINIVGGLCVGCLMNQMAPADAVSKYTILTIGDGLSSQLPSLLMSIAAGIFMTRASGANSLGSDLVVQITSKPNPLFLAAGFLILIALSSPVTGLPWLPFILFAGGLIVAGLSVLVNADVQSQLGQLESVRQNMQDLVNPNRMYERLGVDVLSLQVGAGLLVIADPDQEGQLLAKIAALRQRVTDELGYILPNIRIMDSSALEANEYLIAIRGNTVATGFVYPGKYMVIADQWDSVRTEVPDDAIVGVDPTYQTQAYWVSEEDAKSTKAITAVDATDVVITHLQEITRKHVDDIMTKTDVLKLMELVRSQDPTLVNDLVPTIISTSDLRKIFVNLIREKVSIKDIIFIFERLCDYARFSKEPDILSERLRAALGRQICLGNVQEDKVLYALTLSPEWEKVLDDSCQRTELGTMFLLNPMQVQELIETTAATLMNAHQNIGKQPVILCSPRIRLPLFQLLERHIPTIVVISYSELITDIKVEAVDTIGESYMQQEQQM